MSERRNKNGFGVAGIDNDCADMLSVFQSYILPRESAVGGLVHPVAIGDIAANASFAGAHIDDIVIGAGNLECSDRADGILIKQGLPVVTPIRGLPHSARDRSEVINVRLTRNTFDCQ